MSGAMSAANVRPWPWRHMAMNGATSKQFESCPAHKTKIFHKSLNPRFLLLSFSHPSKPLRKTVHLPELRHKEGNPVLVVEALLEVGPRLEVGLLYDKF